MISTSLLSANTTTSRRARALVFSDLYQYTSFQWNIRGVYTAIRPNIATKSEAIINSCSVVAEAWTAHCTTMLQELGALQSIKNGLLEETTIFSRHRCKTVPAKKGQLSGKAKRNFGSPASFNWARHWKQGAHPVLANVVSQTYSIPWAINQIPKPLQACSKACAI